jgi:hypothetical protein
MRKNSRREKTLLGLKQLDYRFKRVGSYKDWNDKVKTVFNHTGVYSFEDLVSKDIYTAEYLISSFKG